ncbi:MAG: hypothetical protein ABW133_19505 [Polyangiaceae bacterium]
MNDRIAHISRALALLALAACGGRVETMPSGGGGSTGGSSARGGNAGNAGISGTGGVNSAGANSGGAGGRPGSGGTASGAGTGGEGGTAGTSDTGGSAGSGSTGGTGGSGGSTPPPNPDGACWRSSFPEITAITPIEVAAVSCGRAMENQSWAVVTASAGDGGAGDTIDNQAFLVGRWVACGYSWPDPGAIEFGTNNRWRHWAGHLGGAFEPVKGDPPTSRGTYTLRGNGRLNLEDDRGAAWINDRDAGWSAKGTVLETSPDKQAIRVTGMTPLMTTGFYVRADPSPLNGSDNPPATESQSCRLVGTWDATADSGPNANSGSFAFDDTGRFVGAPGTGTDLCTTRTTRGTYALSSGTFMLTTGFGMGICSYWFRSGYVIRFEADCSRAHLTRAVFDDCEFGRTFFNEPTTLVKRR